ncbi:MAG TPA: PadR family transcriptional regulator [Candidatus Saccharimonadales bacterium]|nr:PadR family transcriptional regulator [Candidatus Saccharimonadales bacterium]
MEESNQAKAFLDQSETQMRKGMLVYCVLLLCKEGKIYSSQIINRLHQAELIVVEGTLYPLLSRLARDGLLGYEWRESEQGPPRKYYWLTDEGKTALRELQQTYRRLNASIDTLEKGKA